MTNQEKHSSDKTKPTTSAERDNEIDRLGLEAQRDASGSHEQQQKLERLISAISQPDWLKVSSNKHKLPKEGHREVTDTAIQDIGLRLIKKIQAGEFDPQKGKISHFVKNSISSSALCCSTSFIRLIRVPSRCLTR